MRMYLDIEPEEYEALEKLGHMNIPPLDVPTMIRLYVKILSKTSKEALDKLKIPEGAKSS